MKKHIKTKKAFYLLFLCSIILLLNSCLPHREIVYLQDHSKKKDYTNPYGELQSITTIYKLRPNDRIYVNVTTSIPKFAEFFNQGYGSGLNISAQNLNLFTYLIDDNMNIDFPYVGIINLQGCTVEEAAEIIIESLLPFLNDAQVIVKLFNPSFIALGEFGRPGRIDMGKEQVSIYEAIALAGDIKPIGKKKLLQIVRPSQEGSIIYFVDVTDRNILDSEQYYIYPNDIIYIRPMKARMFGIGETFSLGVLGTVLSLTLSIFALSRVL